MLTVGMGVMVGAMVISLYLPMFDYIKLVPTGELIAWPNACSKSKKCLAKVTIVTIELKMSFSSPSTW